MFLVVTFLFYKFEFGGIHKPCGHGGGRDGGVCQMSILLHKLYQVKWSTKEEGGQKRPNLCQGIFMKQKNLPF